MKHLFLLPAAFYICFSAAAQNTRDFMPVLDSVQTSSEEIVHVDMGETTQLLRYVYRFEQREDGRFLLTQTFDPEGRISTELTEEVTPEGLRYAHGFVYSYGANFAYDAEDVVRKRVRARKKVTFPFCAAADSKGWKTHWKTSYGLLYRTVVRSDIQFLGVDTIQTCGEEKIVLRLQRAATCEYKRPFRRKQQYAYTYTLTYALREGLTGYECTGDSPQHAKVTSRKKL